MPKVSIGMPVYNGELHIREALDSLLAQTFEDFELIISDNASVDKTSQICLEYSSRDSRIFYVRQLENIGALENFQYVLHKARGEFFMWAAYDDLWDSNWIESMLTVFKNREEFLAFGSLRRIDAFGAKVFQFGQNEDFNFSGQRLARRIKFFASNPRSGKANPIYGLARTDFVRKINFYNFRKHAYGADMLFLYSLLQEACIVQPRSHSCFYKRIHMASVGSSSAPTSRQRSSIYSVLRSSLLSLFEPFHRTLVYISYSKAPEIAIICLLLPFLLIDHLIFVVRSRIAH